MSFRYYDVLKIIKKLHSEEFKFPYAKKILFTLYIVGAITFVLCYFLALNGSKALWIPAIIGLLLAVFSLIYAVRREKSSPHDYKGHVNDVNKLVKEIGLDTAVKIQTLQIEVKEKIQESEAKSKQLAGLVSKLLLLVFWVPSGFLISYWLNNNPTEISDLETLVLWIGLLFMLTMLSIGLLMILFFPVSAFILQPLRQEQERVLQYLNDILYYCDYSQAKG